MVMIEMMTSVTHTSLPVMALSALLNRAKIACNWANSDMDGRFDVKLNTISQSLASY